MSTDHPPLDDLDLSAHLDDEAGTDVSARLEIDAPARDRLEQLRFVRDAVASTDVPTLPAERVDALIAAALATGSEDASNDDDDTGRSTEPEVVPVPPSSRPGGPPLWAVAAVVVVLVGLGLTLVWNGLDEGNSDSDTAFTEIGSSISVDDAEPESSTAADMSAEAGIAGGAASTGPAAEAGEASTTTAATGPVDGPPTLVNLGEFPDTDALRVHLRESFPTDGGEAGPLPDTGIDDDLTAAFRCLGKVDGLFEPTGEPTGVGLAMVAGDPTVVFDMPYRTDDGRDTTLVVAVDEVSCIPVLTFQR